MFSNASGAIYPNDIAPRYSNGRNLVSSVCMMLNTSQATPPPTAPRKLSMSKLRLKSFPVGSVLSLYHCIAIRVHEPIAPNMIETIRVVVNTSIFAQD